jgi:hypothetical protein
MAVPDDPLQALAFFQFQSGGQGCRTDEVILAVLAAATDDLEL